MQDIAPPCLPKSIHENEEGTERRVAIDEVGYYCPTPRKGKINLKMQHTAIYLGEILRLD